MDFKGGKENHVKKEKPFGEGWRGVDEYHVRIIDKSFCFENVNKDEMWKMKHEKKREMRINLNKCHELQIWSGIVCKCWVAWSSLSKSEFDGNKFCDKFFDKFCDAWQTIYFLKNPEIKSNTQHHQDN